MRVTAFRRAAVCMLLASLLSGVGTGCGVFDVTDPTAIEEDELANATGAELMRRQVIKQWYGAVAGSALVGGMLGDEFLVDMPPDGIGSPPIPAVVDRRDPTMADPSGNVDGKYGEMQELRRLASAAAAQLRRYGTAAVRQAYIGQMHAARGYAALSLAEVFCPGFPLNELVDGRVVPGAPLTTDAVLERAIAEFDTAIADAADSARIVDAARLGRARALLGLGRFTEAAEAAAAVSTEYVWTTEFSSDFLLGQSNPMVFRRNAQGARASVANREGGTGLDYVSANDPRVQVALLGPAYDGVTGIYRIGKYPDRAAPIVLASGVEARLIEAEAALHANEPKWLTILNDLRATRVTPALAPLADPGTPAAQLDLLVRERAFWLFATGRRLGDLRRLVRVYGRTAESVFPTGPYRQGGEYGTATSARFPAEAEAVYNPAVTGCTGS